MCGRFALTISPTVLARLFSLPIPMDPIEPRYNIAPSELIVAIREDCNEQRIAQRLQWGLIPSWANDPSIAMKLINARSETVHEKPAFREAFKSCRCLIPVSGFYEWQKLKSGKQPYYFQLIEEECFALAGLWQSWAGPQGKTIDSCTILTTAANEIMQPIHHRMPVIIRPGDYSLWLDTTSHSTKRLNDLFNPLPAELMKAHPVTSKMNSPRFDAAECVEEVSVKSEDEGWLF